MTCKSCGLEKQPAGEQYRRAKEMKLREIDRAVEDIQDLLDEIKWMVSARGEAPINKLILKIKDFKRLVRRVKL